MQPLERLAVGRVLGDVEVLAADHPERGAGEDARHVGRRIGERERERLREQRVAGEDRDVLAERDVRARPAAAQVVVVERGQVVVHEAERVHELDRERGRDELVERTPERLAGREAEHRPDPLAAAEQRVAQRLLEPAQLLRDGQRAELLLDERAQLVRCVHRPRAIRA